MPRAPFISLDGLDGTGKSTQCRLLAQWLRERGLQAIECADPGGTAIGNVLRDLLLGHRQEMALSCEMLLFMASRAQLVSEIIKPALESGQAVISDRFLLANVVYQGHAGGLDPRQLWEVGRLATGNLIPDLTIVLDLDPEQAMTRRGRPADRVESRDLEYHIKVRNGFLAEACLDPDHIRVIQADHSVELIHRAICEEVTRVLEAGLGA
jgi:dTMP kinase